MLLITGGKKFPNEGKNFQLTIAISQENCVFYLMFAPGNASLKRYRIYHLRKEELFFDLCFIFASMPLSDN